MWPQISGILDFGFWILDFGFGGFWIWGFRILGFRNLGDFGTLDFGDFGFVGILDFGFWISLCSKSLDVEAPNAPNLGDFGFWILGILEHYVADLWVQILDFWGFWILGILDFGFWILEFRFLDFGFWILWPNFGFYIRRRRLCTPTRVGGFAGPLSTFFVFSIFLEPGHGRLLGMILGFGNYLNAGVPSQDVFSRLCCVAVMCRNWNSQSDLQIFLRRCLEHSWKLFNSQSHSTAYSTGNNLQYQHFRFQPSLAGGTTSSSAQAGTTRGRADGFSVEAHLLQKIYQFRRQSLVWPTERCCPKCAPWRARCTALSLPTLSKALQFSMSDLFCKRIEQRTWIHETHIFFHIFRFSPAFFLVLASERVWPSPTLSSKSLTANRLVLPTLLCWISWRNPQRTHTLLLSHTSLIKLE